MIVVAMETEKRLADLSKDNSIMVTGVGGINVIKSLWKVDRNIPIHNVGYAGSNCIPKGTRVRIGKVKHYHPNVDFVEPIFGLDGDVPCYTSDDFVLKTEIKEPCVFDMELAYILALGFTNVTAEKIISDNLNEEEFEQCLKK